MGSATTRQFVPRSMRLKRDAAPPPGARRLPARPPRLSHGGTPSHERHRIRRPARSPHVGQRARADGGRPGRLPWYAVRSPAGGRAAPGRAAARSPVGGRARGGRLRAAAAEVQNDGRTCRAGHRRRLADRQCLVRRPRRRPTAGDGVDPRRGLRVRLVRRSPRRRRPGPYGSSSSPSTTACAPRASGTSPEHRPTAGSWTRSPRSAGSRTTSPPSAETPAGSPSSASPREPAASPR